MAAPLFRISLFNGARSPRLPHSVPLSGTRAGTLPVEGPCVKYKHLCKFYTGLEPACIKNIHLCSGLTFKILFNYSILAILSKFGTHIAIFRGNSVRNTGQQIKKIRRQAVNIYGKTEQISAPPQPPSGAARPPPKKPPPLIEPSNHRNIPLLCGRRKQPAAAPLFQSGLRLRSRVAAADAQSTARARGAPSLTASALPRIIKSCSRN